LAAREHGCLVAGVEYGARAVADAQQAADAAGLCDRVGFIVGDAEALPFDDGQFDVALCECSLCMFGDKGRALRELHRALRPGGRLAISDVVADHERLSDPLRGAMATIACVGTALSRDGYERLLTAAGFTVLAAESRDGDALEMAERLEDRLRGVRVLGLDVAEAAGFGLDEAIELAGLARNAIAAGALGYAIFAAAR
jgi:SAM-dependent methyltransferase